MAALKGGEDKSGVKRKGTYQKYSGKEKLELETMQWHKDQLLCLIIS